jgi:hypothetical protein
MSSACLQRLVSLPPLELLALGLMIVLAHACAGADALPHADPADGSVTTPDGGDDIDSGGEGGVDQQPDASPTADGGPTDGAADGEACSLLGSGLLSFRWSARPGDDEVAAVASTRGGQVYALHIDDNQEAHVSRLEDDGTIQWKKSFLGQRDFDAGSGYVMPAGVASDSLGRVVIVGTFQRTVSFAGELRSAAPAGNRTPQAIFAMRLNEDGTTSYLETFDGVDLSAVGVAIDTSKVARSSSLVRNRAMVPALVMPSPMTPTLAPNARGAVRSRCRSWYSQ